MVDGCLWKSQSYNLYEKITTRDTITSAFEVITLVLDQVGFEEGRLESALVRPTIQNSTLLSEARGRRTSPPSERRV